ncbi:MAG: hypothetical protein KBD78_03000 [Oligoflexales bacterium]|nr:hypothetical protein [Oligoflexales bacterium]
MKNLSTLLILSLFLSHCSHLLENSDFNFTDVQALDPSSIKSDLTIFKTKYGHRNKLYEVETFLCLRQDKPPLGQQFFLLFHQETEHFNSKSLCQSPTIIAFLNANFSVVAFNRPGFGQSNGEKELLGDHNIQAATVALNAVQRFTESRSLDLKLAGVWGYSLGASEALAFVKQKNDPKLKIIAGGGAFDLPAVLNSTNSKEVKSILEKDLAADNSALDNKSIAFDFEELNFSHLYLYHAKSDVTIPSGQAEAFSEALRTSEKRVQIQLIESESHDLPEGKHGALLQYILGKL